MNWFEQTLAVGTQAPDFTAPDQDGRAVTLSALRGRPVVLVFYPADDTPGCTAQLCELRDAWGEIQAAGVLVFGVNPAPAGRHARFRAKHGYPFPLLVDEGARIARDYAAKWPLLVRRTVYAISPEGRIAFARRGKPAPREMLAALERGA